MATLCLPEAELHEGVVWDGPALDRLLDDRERTPILLYPGEEARDIEEHLPPGPVTLVVIDGTWWQARKIVRKNPRLGALPRFTFSPRSPSEYRIRKEPSLSCVSTIEALAHVLGILEKDTARFRSLLDPFRAMIDTQIAFEQALRGHPGRHADKALWPKKPRVHPVFREPDTEIVCIAGEANAWPYRARTQGVGYEDELVHWVGLRLSTGELFERRVAPRQPLAPRTPVHVELSREELAAGGTTQDLVSSFGSFVRESDVVCFWGHYAATLFLEAGGQLPESRLDLRAVSRDYAKAVVGTLEEHVSRTRAVVRQPRVRGRAGRRIEQVAALVGYFRQEAATESEKILARAALRALR
jgi:hypothetical protein